MKTAVASEHEQRRSRRNRPDDSAAGMGVRLRLDVWLAAQGMAESREKAQALVMAGAVSVNGVPAPKPGMRVRPEDRVQVQHPPAHVGRGARKLEAALDRFGIDPEGRISLDVGASTGGFTQVLLDRGARRVYAVDVGRAQLHERIRRDPRVVVRERTNARALGPEAVPEACGLAVADVSFISLRLVLPALRRVLEPAADVVLLVKPQFEVGRDQVGRGGLVRDPALHAAAVRGIAEAAAALGYAILAACPSPIAGATGNREFFLHLRSSGAGLPSERLEALAKEVTQP